MVIILKCIEIFSHSSVSETNIIQVNYTSTNSEKVSRFEVTRCGVGGEGIDEGNPKVHISSYRINKYWGYNVHDKYN